MSAALKSVHCSHQGSEISLVDDVYLTGAICLCQYWSARLQEAETKLSRSKNAKTERTMKLLIGHYQKLLISCTTCRHRLNA